jgi:hypothetical protein
MALIWHSWFEFIITFCFTTMIHYQFKTNRSNPSKRRAMAFIDIFGLSLGVAFFSLVAVYSVNHLNYDDFNLDATSIFRVYETGNSAVDQPKENKANAIYTPTTPAISLSKSTASSMVCTPSMLSRKVFLTSFKLVRRGLAGKKERTCLN